MLKGLRLTVFILSISLWVSPAFSQCATLEELKVKYLKDNQYNEFIDFLNNSKDKQNTACINYYKALTRYAQLKYLEEKQLWDDYFVNGNAYRDQIVESAKNAISQTSTGDCLRAKSRLLVWQFHRDQQDAFHEQALTDLMTDVTAYAKETNDASLIRFVADKLKVYEEKTKAREVYKLYVDKLVSGQMADLELKNIADGFYKEGNLELAEAVYDIYIERISKVFSFEKIIPEYFEIAGFFVYKPTGLYDMAYAEKIYAKIEALGQKNIFSQEAIYLRAFNLEKLKDYKKAGELYLQLIQLYPLTEYFDQAVYKIAMINAYALADLKEARNYFEKLTARPAVKPASGPQIVASFYQLGLLAQWEGDLIKAKDYYNTLVNNSADNQLITVAQAKERLKEIEENKPLSYNLKTFLDLSFKQGDVLLEMGRSELKSSAYILEKGQKIMVSSQVSMPESGCNQIELQYLWSGNLGQARPSVTEGTFQCFYSDSGTKELNLIIISPAGVMDRCFIMVDVY
ncbi:hypothetical protein D4R78_06600 [bacterium]|nr:MAG: hypothetical protein D4R78_06600 [bacterium]